MAQKTAIEWTDSTWSPIRVRVRQDAPSIAKAKGYASLVDIAMKMRGHVGQHCEHVSPGCEHCYAETNNHRCLPSNGTGLPYDRRSRDMVEAFVDEKVLLQPLKWKPVTEACLGCKAALAKGVINSVSGCNSLESRPRRIFVENQSDLFGEWVTDEMLDQVFAVMVLCPQHIFQVLTKRPERMLRYLTRNARISVGLEALSITCQLYERKPSNLGAGLTMSAKPGHEGELSVWPLPNVWLGVSVEGDTVRERARTLLKVPAAKRFLSCEPLIESLSLRWIEAAELGTPHARHKFPLPNAEGYCVTDEYDGLREFDWVICGGESGPNARPMQPAWARSLRDQCAAASVPFFFKQWGEWVGIESIAKGNGFRLGLGDGIPISAASDLKRMLRWENDTPRAPRADDTLDSFMGAGSVLSFRSGKVDAGALLDGREWKQFPEVYHG